MKKQNMSILDTEITILEYKGQRVLTLAMIDKMHQRATGTARRNFNQNKERFTAGKHYIFIPKTAIDEIRTIGLTAAPNGVYLFTEGGYLLLAKSLQDDRAWDVQDNLIDKYFRVKEQLKIQRTKPKALPKPQAQLPGKKNYTLNEWENGILISAKVVDEEVIHDLVEASYPEWLLINRAKLNETLSYTKKQISSASAAINSTLEPLYLLTLATDTDTAMEMRQQQVMDNLNDIVERRHAH